jgi:hypothetical protein
MLTPHNCPRFATPSQKALTYQIEALSNGVTPRRRSPIALQIRRLENCVRLCKFDARRPLSLFCGRGVFCIFDARYPMPFSKSHARSIAGYLRFR